MKLYLAGPMRGYPGLNHAAFHRGAAALRERGCEVFCPAEHDVEMGIGPDDEKQAMAMLRQLLGADLAWICSQADGITVLPGWQRSAGALAEVHTAWALSMPVWELASFLADGPAALRVLCLEDG